MSSGSVWCDVYLAEAPDLGCIIALTGEYDYVSDGDVVVKLSNGHEYVSARTGKRRSL